MYQILLGTFSEFSFVYRILNSDWLGQIDKLNAF